MTAEDNSDYRVLQRSPVIDERIGPNQPMRHSRLVHFDRASQEPEIQAELESGAMTELSAVLSEALHEIPGGVKIVLVREVEGMPRYVRYEVSRGITGTTKVDVYVQEK